MTGLTSGTERDGVFYQLGRLFGETQADPACRRFRSHPCPGEVHPGDWPFSLFQLESDLIFARDFGQKRTTSHDDSDHERGPSRRPPPGHGTDSHGAAGVLPDWGAGVGPLAAPGIAEGAAPGEAAAGV